MSDTLRMITGRCGTALSDWGSGYGAMICALPADHAGWHRSDEGTEWGTAIPDPYDALLLPAGGETEWGWLSADGATVYRSPSEGHARAAASRSGARQLMRRRLGPWLPAPIDGGTDDTR